MTRRSRQVARIFCTGLMAGLLTWAEIGCAQTPAPQPFPAPAPSAPPPADQQAAAPIFKPEELEALVAPIALYPDSLLSQVLMASTYPLEIVYATRWVKANPKVKGDAAIKAVESQTWDVSVKSLVAFPQILEPMSDKLEWTQKLGDAFLAQQKDVLDAVQRLRARAEKSGNLKTNEQQKVIVEPAPAPPPGQPAPAQQTIVRIEPAQPDVIYVPAYNPTVVYAGWSAPPIPLLLAALSRLLPGRGVDERICLGCRLCRGGRDFRQLQLGRRRCRYRHQQGHQYRPQLQSQQRAGRWPAR